MASAVDIRVGIEKEGLRVRPDGGVAQTPHPKGLGSTLSHPHITTDYSEALLELVTPPLPSNQSAIRFLRDLHVYTYKELGEDTIWASSMPCVVQGESSIPIADYGPSNAGQMKHIYRVGLGNRYGRMMQVIAGIHYNFSFSDEFWKKLKAHHEVPDSLEDYKSSQYLALLRNILRVGWMNLYLFGASPAICASFLKEESSLEMKLMRDGTYYMPYATSLRMGDMGYQNNKEEETGVEINYNCLPGYIDSMEKATGLPCAGYAKIGVKVGDEYKQLNANCLQIENEYYSTVRPKSVPQYMEKPVNALRRTGIEYIELRSLDIDPFESVGIGMPQARFLEMFMLYCLLEDSPSFADGEQRQSSRNLNTVAHFGRQPGLTLPTVEGDKEMREWGISILEAMRPIAELFDSDEQSENVYQQSLTQQIEKFENPDQTPSACVLNNLLMDEQSFHGFSRQLSEKHKAEFKQATLAPEQQRYLDELVETSHTKTAAIEAADTVSFDEFLRNYFASQSSVSG